MKRYKFSPIRLLIVCFLAVFLLLFTCCSVKNTKYVGIISAMDNEISLLLDEMDIKRTDTHGGNKYYVGVLRDKDVIITKSGVGKIRSASSVTCLLENYSIKEVIFTGIAGGVRDDENVLDKIIATSLVEHDYGILSNEGFTWRGGDPGFGNEEGVVYYCDEALVKLAYEAALSIISEDEKVLKGVVASGDQFIASEEYVKWLSQEFDAYACEMEGASTAEVCTRYQIPFVVIRTLSDKADGKAHESYADFGDKAADESCKIVLKMLESMNE